MLYRIVLGTVWRVMSYYNIDFKVLGKLIKILLDNIMSAIIQQFPLLKFNNSYSTNNKRVIKS